MALNSIDSKYVMGKVRMVASEFTAGEVCKNNKEMKVKGVRNGGGEMGGFMLCNGRRGRIPGDWNWLSPIAKTAPIEVRG